MSTATETEICMRRPCRENSTTVKTLGILLRVVFVVNLLGFLWLWTMTKAGLSNQGLFQVITFEHVFASTLVLTITGFVAHLVLHPRLFNNQGSHKEHVAAGSGITSSDTCARRTCHAERLLLRNWTVLFALAVTIGLGGLAWIILTWHGEITAGHVGTFFGFLSGGLLGFFMKGQARQLAKRRETEVGRS